MAYEKTRTWLRRGNLKREIQSVLIPIENNAIRTNFVKTKIIIHRRRATEGDEVREIKLLILKLVNAAN